MDHFETIACTLLEHAGYWVRRSFKVELPQEKRDALGKSSMPRVEIDLLAFKPSENLIVAFEAKSYLDSPGVSFKEIKATHKRPKGRYKIFTCKGYREVVLKRLKAELIKRGMATKKTEIKLGLIAAKVHGGAEKASELAAYMSKNGWEFWRPSYIKTRLKKLSNLDYENDVAVLVSKILLRKQL